MKKIIKQILLAAIIILAISSFCVYEIKMEISCGELVKGFYFIYFALPFIVLLLIYILLRTFIRVSICLKNSNELVDKKKDLFELESKKSRNFRIAFQLILILAFCILVTFSIILIHSPNIAKEKYSDVLSVNILSNADNITNQDYEYKLNIGDISVYEYLYHGYITFSKEIALNCPEYFIDTYYDSLLDNKIYTSKRTLGTIENFSTKNGYGEYYYSNMRDEIAIIYRYDNNIISLLLRIENQESGFSVNSPEKIILLLQDITSQNTGGRQGTSNTGDGSVCD